MKNTTQITGTTQIEGTIQGYKFDAILEIEITDDVKSYGFAEFSVPELDYDKDDDLIFDLMNAVGEAIKS